MKSLPIFDAEAFLKVAEEKEIRHVCFDVDDTILRGQAGTRHMFYLVFGRHCSPGILFRWPYYQWMYAIGRLDYPSMVEDANRTVMGLELSFCRELGKQCFEKTIRHRLYPRAIEFIERLKKEGFRIVLNSASPEDVIAPMAHHLGVDYISTQLEVVEGRFTGKLSGTPCYGEGKVDRLQDFWGDPTFAAFSDSSSDRPLLEASALPVVIHPNKGMQKVMMEKHWKAYRF